MSRRLIVRQGRRLIRPRWHGKRKSYRMRAHIPAAEEGSAMLG